MNREHIDEIVVGEAPVQYSRAHRKPEHAYGGNRPRAKDRKQAAEPHRLPIDYRKGSGSGAYPTEHKQRRKGEPQRECPRGSGGDRLRSAPRGSRGREEKGEPENR